ncbi:uncharacterized protein DEA37_0011409 [Paragonimus westermani]|uniref:Uncharacterized protein n=1 Tax=Paragonimus westermani TaxID=34504 RepID=A0A5J4NFR5_9TREM|nr:uncharacterized protein DEA37_0011409 [Paragonimus westermani]
MLFAYDFTIQYRPTTSFGQADALSRLIGSQAPNDEDTIIAAINIESDVHRILSDAVRALPVTAEMIKEATKMDPTLRQVMTFICTSPHTDLSGDLREYFHRREALTIVDGCIMFADRVAVPEAPQRQVLKQFYTEHPGVNRMKSLARSFAY